MRKISDNSLTLRQPREVKNGLIVPETWHTCRLEEYLPQNLSF